MPKPIDTPEYWIESYSPTGRELDWLYEFVLEAGRPQNIEALAGELVRSHVAKAMEAIRASQKADGTAYRPSDRHKVGQKLVFPVIDGAEGVVESIRPGNNPDYGEYQVITIKLGGQSREFATGLMQEHSLSQVVAEVDPDETAARFAPLIAPQLASVLSDDKEWLRYGDRWILKALLPEIHAGHCNLAEAILMLGGEPLPADQILPELELDEAIALEARTMALEIALAGDRRFRNVGAHESPLWTLATQT